ncbi:MAG: 50S ribosomal protein L24 [Anaerolineae bacterium]|nr:50S ribosomal protein L24 [Anaerolineae bacterium]
MRGIKQGDTVEVISGNDRGRRGAVHRLIPKKDRVVVSGINLVKKHQRPMPTGGRMQTQAGIIEFEAPIRLSNVMLVCPQCDQRTRVAFEFREDGGKVRVCKKCDAIID